MFHDAPVSRIAIHGGELRMETEEFAFSPTATVPPARITIGTLHATFRNGVEVAAFAIESDDPEIYGVECLADGVRLHLIWSHWAPRTPETWCTYWFPGATMRAEALSGGPLVPVEDGPDPACDTGGSAG